MKFLRKISFLIILITLFLPTTSFAVYRQWNCVNSNHDPATVGPFVNTDCNENYIIDNIVSVSLDRTVLQIMGSSGETGVFILGPNGSGFQFSDDQFGYYYYYGITTAMLSSSADGTYYLFTGSIFAENTQQAFYIKDGLFYLEFPESSSGGSVLPSPLITRDDGTIVFGLGIIIFFLSIMFLGFIFNAFGFSKRK